MNACKPEGKPLLYSGVVADQHSHSVFIDRAFENYVRALLAGSKFCLQEHVDEMVQVFESKTVRKIRLA